MKRAKKASILQMEKTVFYLKKVDREYANAKDFYVLEYKVKFRGY
ncbi:MAG: hypothetical protein ACK5LL_11495 [Suipraeoptans sp.]